ncbi:hypothetical protein [Methylobacterium gnaphalii]|uniref:Uncharacterized protein n=1 Tax=Methylobacterium gnaphalii TaxID=1010610 RepID=A0A512JPA5_9HYPH|nr:hypothetical protein [Methylobacterium gnaphalii]GEP11769.1 hypothetical protein MGN01_36140 [Methylobacterium gnaphalii]GJD69445.1 hypothetical protein MMMDOFMJ_2376 [Methylobacterium gnaphalii]GLS49596.1 hypothetical protein GCM10007885_24450 [Methylobacterium gnaphalii]
MQNEMLHVDELRRERAELQSAIDRAEHWGAATTARYERILGIDAALRFAECLTPPPEAAPIVYISTPGSA